MRSVILAAIVVLSGLAVMPQPVVGQANAGVDQSVLEGEVVTLDVSPPSTSPCTLCTYGWKLVDGPASVMGEHPEQHPGVPYVATPGVAYPEPDGPGRGLCWAPTLADSLTDGDQFIDDPTARPPVEAAMYREPLAPYKEPDFLCQLSSSDHRIGAGAPPYVWHYLEKPGGMSNAHQVVKFLAPRIQDPCPVEGIVLTLELSRMAPGLLEPQKDRVDITVKRRNWAGAEQQNRCPVADAGPNQVVSESSLVKLFGGGSSDPDESDTLSLCWRYASGDPILVNGALQLPRAWHNGPLMSAFQPMQLNPWPALTFPAPYEVAPATSAEHLDSWVGEPPAPVDYEDGSYGKYLGPVPPQANLDEYYSPVQPTCDYTPVPATALVDFATDRVTSVEHGLIAGDRVTFKDVDTPPSLPGPISASKSYYVVQQDRNSFAISVTRGGPPVDIMGSDTSGTLRITKVTRDEPYFWNADDPARPQFFAPVLGPDDPPSVDLVFDLTVTDRSTDARLWATDRVVITVKNTNQAPHDILSPLREDSNKTAVKETRDTTLLPYAMRLGDCTGSLAAPACCDNLPAEGPCRLSSVDLITGRDSTLIFSIPRVPDVPVTDWRGVGDGVMDDRGVLAAEAVLTNLNTGAVLHVPLRKSGAVEDTCLTPENPHIPSSWPDQPQPRYGPRTADPDKFPDGYLGMWDRQAALNTYNSDGTLLQDNPWCEERSFWTSEMKVRDAKELVTGEYEVLFYAYDGDGGVGIGPLSGQDGSPEPLSFSVEVDYSANPTVGLSGITLDEAPRSNGCFPGTTRVPQQYVTSGDVLRLDIAMPAAPDIPETDPSNTQAQNDAIEKEIVQLSNPLFLLRKVTYQICVKSGTESSIGPEVTLGAPYQLTVENLVNGAQEVLVRAEDRDGHVTEIVIPVVTDASAPLAVIRVPELTYRGVPFTARVLVSDGSTEVAQATETTELRIVDLVETDSGTEDGLFTQTNKDAGVLTLLKLDSTNSRRLELTRDAVREYVVDGNGDGLLDGYLDPTTLAITLFAARDCNSDARPDYTVDLDDDGTCSDGDLVLIADPTDVVRDVLCPKPGATPAERASLCNVFNQAATNGDPQLDTLLRSSRTVLHEFEVTREVLGQTTYRVSVKDSSGNRFARDGALETIAPLVDVGAVRLGIDPGSLPALPGDLVAFVATVRQSGGSAEVPITIALSGATTINVPGVPVPAASTTIYGDEEGEVLSDRFLPGRHRVTLTAVPPLGLLETNPGDQSVSVDFEVFLGQVIDNQTGESYFVRADAAGLPRTGGGAIRESDNATFNLVLDPIAGRYEFLDGNRSLYWDPLARDDDQRPVTTVPVEAAPPPPKKDSPGIGAVLGLLALAALALAMRRRGA